jgi:hypothetical protein
MSRRPRYSPYANLFHRENSIKRKKPFWIRRHKFSRFGPRAKSAAGRGLGGAKAPRVGFVQLVS